MWYLHIFQTWSDDEGDDFDIDCYLSRNSAEKVAGQQFGEREKQRFRLLGTAKLAHSWQDGDLASVTTDDPEYSFNELLDDFISQHGNKGVDFLELLCETAVIKLKETGWPVGRPSRSFP